MSSAGTVHPAASLGAVSGFSPATAICRLMPAYRVVVDDDVDVRGHSAGGGYEKFGIDSSRGAIVVVRPDSFVGAVAPLQGINALTKYFDGFWTSSI